MENKEKIRSLAENVWAYIAAFLRWGVLGLLVGGLGGFVGALFAKSVAWATAMRGAPNRRKRGDVLRQAVPFK